MLSIRWGTTEDTIELVGSVVDNNYEEAWFEDPLVCEMVLDLQLVIYIIITQMGDNALAFVSVLSKHRDVTGLCYRFLPFDQMNDIDFYKDYQKVDIGDVIKFDSWTEFK